MFAARSRPTLHFGAVPRVAATTPDLLLAAAWAGSYQWGVAAVAGDSTALVARGHVLCRHVPRNDSTPATSVHAPGQVATLIRVVVDPGWRNVPIPVRFAGFGYLANPGEDTVLLVPFWFPTLLSAWLTVTTWERYGRRPRGGHGFPVGAAKGSPG
jgi:hypothetical protein